MGSFKCVCNKGYEIDSNGVSCIGKIFCTLVFD